MKQTMRRIIPRLVCAAVLVFFILTVISPVAEARRSGRDPVQPGKTNCRLAKDSIKMPGYPLYDLAGNLVATKRVTILWRYVDNNCDGVMTWGVGPAERADYLRIVPRTIYDFSGAITPVQDANNEVQLTTHHFGPWDSTLLGGAGAFRPTAFREIHHDDFIPGFPKPGDLEVTLCMDCAPIPGLTARVQLFTDSGDFDFVPGAATTWGAKFVLMVDPLLSDGTIPAGAFFFFDAQLNVYDIVPSTDGTCEFGFSEEDWINVNGGGAIQVGPNTTNTTDPNVVPVPVHFAPQCSNNTPAE